MTMRNTLTEMDIGDVVRAAREEARISQTVMALRLGFTSAAGQARISRWERGEQAPELHELGAIETALDLPKGTIVRRLGMVHDLKTTEEVLRTDPHIRGPYRDMVIDAYKLAKRRSGKD